MDPVPATPPDLMPVLAGLRAPAPLFHRGHDAPATSSPAPWTRTRPKTLPALLSMLLLVAGCGQPATQPAPPTGPAPGTQAFQNPSPADAAGGAYAVDAAASLIAVTVRRGGMLARLGHDHVVAVRALTGRVASSLDRADLSFRLDGMTVDEPQLLHDAGIATQPSAQAVEGTRHNMLGPVLDAARYPVVTLHAQRLDGEHLQVDVTLHGVTRRLALPAVVHADAAQVSASGTARLKQTDFGITPFAVGAGLLAVDDALEIRYRIVAQRADGVQRP